MATSSYLNLPLRNIEQARADLCENKHNVLRLALRRRDARLDRRVKDVAPWRAAA